MNLDLFLTFLKLGAFTFGGGYAMIPLLQAEFVDKRQWFERDDFTDIIVLSQSLPGAFAVNSACIIGYKKKGVLGAICGVLGCILPAFISTILVAIYLDKLLKIKAINNFFSGVKPAVCALITFSVYKMLKSSKLKPAWYVISISAFIAIAFLKFDPLYCILLGAFLGIIFKGGVEANADN